MLNRKRWHFILCFWIFFLLLRTIIHPLVCLLSCSVIPFQVSALLLLAHWWYSFCSSFSPVISCYLCIIIFCNCINHSVNYINNFFLHVLTTFLFTLPEILNFANSHFSCDNNVNNHLNNKQAVNQLRSKKPQPPGVSGAEPSFGASETWIIPPYFPSETNSEQDQLLRHEYTGTSNP